MNRDIKPENPFIPPDMAIRPPTEQRLRELYAMANATHYLGDPLRQAPDLAPVLSFLITEHAAHQHTQHGLPEFDPDHMLHHEEGPSSNAAEQRVMHVEVSPEMLARIRRGECAVVSIMSMGDAPGESTSAEKSDVCTPSLHAVMTVLSCLANGAHARDELGRLTLPSEVVTESLRYLGHHGLITCHEGLYAITSAGAWAINMHAKN